MIHYRGCCFAILVLADVIAFAHPIVENALDVVVAPDRLVIDARIALEEITLVGEQDGKRISKQQSPALFREHCDYILNHIHVRVDGQSLKGHAAYVGGGAADDVTDPSLLEAGPLVPYQLDYRLAAPPHIVQIEQDFLCEFEQWTVPCVLRIRRSDQDQFKLLLLSRGQSYRFPCEWSPDMLAAPRSAVAPDAVHTAIPFWPTAWAYLVQGNEHILTGYDHLLFVTALVLAARRFWDLVAIVAAFTLAHTLTLTLSLLNIVSVSERIVEPMIAGSIVFTALQNIFWPRSCSGWSRIAVAFGFGLFHGLGFAGGLKDAMAELPTTALWIALISFSLGVEIGHQIVIVPLFSALHFCLGRFTEPVRSLVSRRLTVGGSAAVALAGAYYLAVAIW